MRHKSNPPVPRIDNLRFWGEQWVKHGTCSVSMLDQYEYFSLALKLYNGINLREMLRKESVIPRGTLVARQAIFDAIRKHMKCKPQIRCQEIQNQYYLYEIRFCLTASKDPKFIDCNTEFVGCSINPEVYF
ncbi:putative ribonuclease T(2) [Medicago truncatula]|nr:putative ribonuclease T(2) [Medicago truncatula]